MMIQLNVLLLFLLLVKVFHFIQPPLFLLLSSNKIKPTLCSRSMYFYHYADGDFLHQRYQFVSISKIYHQISIISLKSIVPDSQKAIMRIAISQFYACRLRLSFIQNYFHDRMIFPVSLLLLYSIKFLHISDKYFSLIQQWSVKTSIRSNFQPLSLLRFGSLDFLKFPQCSVGNMI